MTMSVVLRSKKQKSSQILVHIQICNFFFYQFFHHVSSASLDESAQIGRGASVRPSAWSSVHPICSALWLDLLCQVLASCSRFLLPVCQWGGARVLSASSTQGRQGQSFGYVHIHGRSMASNKKQHYFRRSSTHTWDRGGQKSAAGPTITSRSNSPEQILTDPSDALAPTLSPAAFQQTSKIPPVPL